MQLHIVENPFTVAPPPHRSSLLLDHHLLICYSSIHEPLELYQWRGSCFGAALPQLSAIYIAAVFLCFYSPVAARFCNDTAFTSLYFGIDTWFRRTHAMVPSHLSISDDRLATSRPACYWWIACHLGWVKKWLRDGSQCHRASVAADAELCFSTLLWPDRHRVMQLRLSCVTSVHLAVNHIWSGWCTMLSTKGKLQ